MIKIVNYFFNQTIQVDVVIDTRLITDSSENTHRYSRKEQNYPLK